MKPTKELIDYADLMERIGSPVVIDFQHERLETLMDSPHWSTYYELFDKQERKVILYYKHHRRGDCTYSPSWTPQIESAIAKVEAEIERQKNLRFCICDRKTNLYWASLIEPPYWRSKRTCFLFTADYHTYLEKLCHRSNRKVGCQRFMVVEIDATKRLNKHRF